MKERMNKKISLEKGEIKRLLPLTDQRHMLTKTRTRTGARASMKKKTKRPTRVMGCWIEILQFLKMKF